MDVQLDDLSQKSLQDVFTLVFKENRWGNDESVSGAGSALGSPSVRESVKTLDELVRSLRIKSINDVPCGDFYWFPLILGRFPYLEYRGFDIVPGLIEWNKQRFPNYNFDVLDVSESALPQADLIFCKDLLLHLRSRDIARTLDNFKKSGSRFLLISNNHGEANLELDLIEPGIHRSVNLTAEPYNLPEPIWRSSYLALWSLDAISVSFFENLRVRLA